MHFLLEFWLPFRKMFAHPWPKPSHQRKPALSSRTYNGLTATINYSLIRNDRPDHGQMTHPTIWHLVKEKALTFEK